MSITGLFGELCKLAVSKSLRHVPGHVVKLSNGTMMMVVVIVQQCQIVKCLFMIMRYTVHWGRFH